MDLPADLSEEEKLKRIRERFERGEIPSLDPRFATEEYLRMLIYRVQALEKRVASIQNVQIATICIAICIGIVGVVLGLAMF